MSETTTIPQQSAAPAETAYDPGEERGVIRGVTWDFYDRLSDSLGEHSPWLISRRRRLTAPGFTVRCRFPRSGAFAITSCRSSSSTPTGTT